MDWPGVTKYRGMFSAQGSRAEIIRDLYKKSQLPEGGGGGGGSRNDFVGEDMHGALLLLNSFFFFFSSLVSPHYPWLFVGTNFGHSINQLD
jgi:hypothetical protein